MLLNKKTFTTDEDIWSFGKKIKGIVLRVGIILGLVSMILGVILTVLVWSEGYYVGALMLVVTGFISVFLGIKEFLDPSDGDYHWLSLFFLIIRRAFFFLNAVLIALVVGTLTQIV